MDLLGNAIISLFVFLPQHSFDMGVTNICSICLHLTAPKQARVIVTMLTSQFILCGF